MADRAMQGRCVGQGAAASPRPPEGDWLGTPYLRFERHGSLAHLIVDRPEMRNALSPAMYFGIRYAVDHVNAEADLHGLLITGVDDIFMPGGDLGGRNVDGWMDLPRLFRWTTRRSTPCAARPSRSCAP